MLSAVALIACLVVVSDVSGQGQPGLSPASRELSQIQAALADASGAEAARKYMEQSTAMGKNELPVSKTSHSVISRFRHS